MRYLSLISGVILFLLALGFALKNSNTITLHYFLGYQWQAPLVLILVTAFCLGAASGIAATLGLIFRQRREIQKLRREKNPVLHATPTSASGSIPERRPDDGI